MKIVEVSSGRAKPAIIREAEEEDFRVLTKKRFTFYWKAIQEIASVYILQIRNSEDILGAMGLVDVPDEKRIEIKLLSSSAENRGNKKRYDGIPGCLIAYACRLSQRKYGRQACVSLVPKTELIGHYMKKYYMQYAGWQLFLEGSCMSKLLKEYL